MGLWERASEWGQIQLLNIVHTLTSPAARDKSAVIAELKHAITEQNDTSTGTQIERNAWMQFIVYLARDDIDTAKYFLDVIPEVKKAVRLGGGKVLYMPDADVRKLLGIFHPMAVYVLSEKHKDAYVRTNSWLATAPDPWPVTPVDPRIPQKLVADLVSGWPAEEFLQRHPTLIGQFREEAKEVSVYLQTKFREEGARINCSQYAFHEKSLESLQRLSPLPLGKGTLRVLADAAAEHADDMRTFPALFDDRHPCQVIAGNQMNEPVYRTRFLGQLDRSIKAAFMRNLDELADIGTYSEAEVVHLLNTDSGFFRSHFPVIDLETTTDMTSPEHCAIDYGLHTPLREPYDHLDKTVIPNYLQSIGCPQELIKPRLQRVFRLLRILDRVEQWPRTAPNLLEYAVSAEERRSGKPIADRSVGGIVESMERHKTAF